MYQKAIVGLLSANLLLLTGAFCVKGIEFNQLMAKPAVQMEVSPCEDFGDTRKTMGMVYRTASEERVIGIGLLELPLSEVQEEIDGQAGIGFDDISCDISHEDYEILLRIVEAEAGGEDEDGKLLVANVVLNRVASEEFPDSISEVVLQSSEGVTQFSPVSSGRIWKVTVSSETVSAVDRALAGEDISQGALYFAARKYANAENMKWFDENLTFLFKHGGHEFYL